MPDPVPSAGLAPELFWLAVAAALTGLLWLPYVLLRMVEHGLMGALNNPSPETQPKTAFGRRLAAAHANAVENLPVFGALALVVVIGHRTSPATATAAMVYVFARLAHFIIYAAGVPVLRTLTFAAGWASCAYLATAAFGLV